MKREITIKTVSPLHIGSQTHELTPLEVVVSAGTCYVINESKLGAELLANNHLDSLALEMQKQGNHFKLRDFLKDMGYLNQRFLEKIAAYQCKTAVNIIPNSLRPFVRDTYGRSFIPGSSLKGVFRTAVIYAHLKRLKQSDPAGFERLVINQVKRKLAEFNDTEHWKRNKPWFKNQFKSKMAAQIETEVMQKFNLPMPASTRNRRLTNQHKDFMRVIKISDSAPLAKDSLQLEEVQVLSLTEKNEVYHKTSIFVEVVPVGTELKFNVTLDNNLLSDFIGENKNVLFKDLDEVISMVEAFAHDLWAYEQRFWNNVSGASELKDFYSQQSAACRVGWGSGLAGTGLLMLLPEDLRKEIRDDLYQPRGSFEFPKSRRVVIKNGIPKLPLGWFKFV